MDTNHLIQSLNQNIALFGVIFGVAGGSRAKWKPSPEKWSALEVACHLLDEEREDFRARITKIFDKDPNWNPIDPEGWVKERNYIDRDIRAVLREFIEERQRSVAWLEKIKGSDWGEKAVHPKFGEFTAGQMLACWLAHDLLHIRQLVNLQLQYLRQSTELSLDYAGTF